MDIQEKDNKKLHILFVTSFFSFRFVALGFERPLAESERASELRKKVPNERNVASSDAANLFGADAQPRVCNFSHE